jgi:acetyl/propionyl-CoA carboxylase alpha subunit
VDKKLNFYFLEMNTRIQVEHPVTEMVTGVDLVEEQILVAAGNKLRLNQDQLSQNGHAIECRIYAEDPSHEFLPSPGEIILLSMPKGDMVRIDTAIDRPVTIESYYDPMISKLVVWAPDRAKAIQETEKMLKKFVVQGIQTNIPYLIQLIQHEAFLLNKISTKFCDTHAEALIQGIIDQKQNTPSNIVLVGYLTYALAKTLSSSIWETIGYWRNRMIIPVQLDEFFLEAELISSEKGQHRFKIEGKHFNGEIISTDNNCQIIRINEFDYHFYISENSKGQSYITLDGVNYTAWRKDVLVDAEYYESGDLGADAGSYFAPMPGKVIKVSVSPGDEVVRGTILLVVEAMKMENNIVATHDATIEAVNVKVGDMVDTEKLLIKLHDKE